MEFDSTAQSFPKQKSGSTTELLLVGLTCAFLAWYIQYLWNRRNLYISSIKLQGPLALPFVGSLLIFIGSCSDILNKLDNMFDIYPEMFRVWYGSKLIYVVSNPKYIDILLTRPQALGKAFLYSVVVDVAGGGLFSAPVSRWRKTRKMIHPAFNQGILNNFVEIFARNSKIFVEVIKSKYAGKGEFEIFEPISRCTLDSICETAMDVQIEAQTTDSEYPLLADRLVEITTTRALHILYHIDSIFHCSALGREFHYVLKKMKTFTKKIIAEKKAQYEKKMHNPEYDYVDEGSPKRKPFLELLLEMNYNMEDAENIFSDDELLDETITFIVAGSDTSATAMCSVLTMLGMHQDIQDKTLAEVLEVIGPDRDVHFSDLPKLKYLERVIKETLRLFPVAGFIARDVDDDIDLGDFVVRKGTTVAIGVLEVQRNEKYWPDRLKFDPDRFLPEEIAKRPAGYYIAFAHGPRNCIGYKYAMMSMMSKIATILREFKVFTSYKRVEDIELKLSFITRALDGYKISLEPRN